MSLREKTLRMEKVAHYQNETTGARCYELADWSIGFLSCANALAHYLRKLQSIGGHVLTQNKNSTWLLVNTFKTEQEGGARPRGYRNTKSI